MQLYENIIVCGIPGLGEDSTPAFTCAPNAAGAGSQVINRRLVVNLIVFFVVSFALVVYGVVNLLGNPLQSPTMLTTQFADASGLYPGFEVELNGVPVGTVTSTALTGHGHQGDDAHQPGTTVPDDVQSSVQIANDLGEQVVNLVPSHGGTGARPGRAAPTCPAAPNQVPGRRRGRRRLGHPAAPGHPGRRPQQADRRAGHVAGRPGGQPAHARQRRARPSPRSSSPTSSSSPSSWPTRRPRSMRSPPSRPSFARTWPTRRRWSRCWPNRRRGCTPCSPRGRPPSTPGGQPHHVPVGQPRLLPARHRRHPLQPRPAHQPDQPVAGPGVQHVLLRRRREHRRRRAWPSPRRRTARTTNQTFLRTRLLLPARPRRAGRSPTERPTPSPTRCPVPGA